MSGPKVVRVKTRAEYVAEAQVWIARVDAAAVRWEQHVRDAGLATSDEIALTRDRDKVLAELVRAHRFEDVERQARQELAYLEDDLDRRIELASKSRVEKRHRRRRLASTSASLLSSLAVGEREVPPAIEVCLTAGRSGEMEDLNVLEAAIAEAISHLVPDEHTSGMNERQKALAAQLSTGEATRTLADWLIQQRPEDDEVATRVDAQIARLEAEACAEAAAFSERARAIAAEPSAKRRRLLADSLELDLAATLTRQRNLSQTRGELENLASELELLAENVEAKELAAKIHAAGEGTLEKLVKLRDQADAWLSQRRIMTKAAVRRETVLSALSAIGYEVKDGMETAWVENRRLIVRRGGRQDIGLELAGNPDADRLQVRAIGFETGSAPWDHTRDSDIEQIFCGDINLLRRQLEENGDEMHVDRAIPIGSQALRTVARPEDQTARPAATKPKLKQQRPS